MAEMLSFNDFTTENWTSDANNTIKQNKQLPYTLKNSVIFKTGFGSIYFKSELENSVLTYSFELITSILRS
jgi:hypothetical protein